MKKENVTPTSETYSTLEDAFAFFNAELFGSKLPPCLITLVRKKSTKGYFWREKFQHCKTEKLTDEIALNPDLFKSRTLAETLSTLVHEMCHMKQHHFGKPSRGGYHNKQWAEYMREVGLIPSDTGKPGGKETGQRVTHYIEKGGVYEKAFEKLQKKDFSLSWQGTIDSAAALGIAKKKRESKTKFTCGDCGQNAWAKPSANLICGDCSAHMLAD